MSKSRQHSQQQAPFGGDACRYREHTCFSAPRALECFARALGAFGGSTDDQPPQREPSDLQAWELEAAMISRALSLFQRNEVTGTVNGWAQ